MKKINILMVITSTGIGGAEKIFFQIIQGLDKKKYQIVVCSLKKKGEIALELEKQGIKVISLNTFDKENFWAVLDSFRIIIKLVFICLKEKINIIHSHLFRANIFSRISGKLVGIPVISSIHTLQSEKKYKLYLEKISSFFVNKIIVVCQKIKDFMIEKAKINPNKIIVIYNGINLQEFNIIVDKKKMYKELKIINEPYIITYVARLVLEKGHIFLFEAMKLILESYPNTILLIVGEGFLLNELKKITYKLEISKNVIFTGVKKNIPEILKITDIFVLPSLREGLSVSILEAMASSIPVIASKISGNQELVDENTGLLVPVKDSFALAKAIKELLDNKEKRIEMGKQGRIKVEKYFTCEKMVKEIENLYDFFWVR
ncbi:MAG: glycosyltransferase [bacterium]